MNAASGKQIGPKSFLDTSVVHKTQLGTSLIQQHFLDNTPQKWYVNNYVQMEYFRHSLVVWIYLYFESADPKYRSFGDAWKLYSEGFGREAKIAVAALTTMESDGYSFAKEEDKELCRERLQDFVYEMAMQFDLTFTDMGADPTNCARVKSKLKIPDDGDERKRQLVGFASNFRDEASCRSKCSISNLFTHPRHRAKLDAIAAATAKSETEKKFKKIRDTIVKSSEEPARITCKTCSKMGDALIAVALDGSWKLHSMDTVHEPISTALKLEFQIHPSESAVCKAASQNPVP